jgi:Flp pilus assembly protein TadG
MTYRQREKGVAAVEFAIVLIPLLVIVTGITEFGRAMYYYATLAKAARDGARLMSTQTPADINYASLKNQATCTVVYGNGTCSGTPLLPGLTTAMVSICDRSNCPATHANVSTGNGVMNLVTLTIGGPNSPYTFQSMAPFSPALFGVGSFNFGLIGVTMRQIL